MQHRCCVVFFSAFLLGYYKAYHIIISTQTTYIIKIYIRDTFSLVWLLNRSFFYTKILLSENRKKCNSKFKFTLQFFLVLDQLLNTVRLEMRQPERAARNGLMTF